MLFASVAPSPGLRHVIRDYLIAHFRFEPGTPVPRKRYSPRPEQGITFFVKGRPSLAGSPADEIRVAPPVAIFGQQMKRCDVCLAPEFLMFRVHFQPGALFRALKIPLYEFGEDYVDAAPILGREAQDVIERLDAATSYAAMVETVEAYLLRRVAGAAHDLTPLDNAAARLTAQPHRPLDRVARDACLSPRQFNRKFIERIGVGPKLYSRLVRYHRAYLFKVAHPAIAWPTVAIDFGYTDYQHMVRDFREFTGATPTTWLQEDAASPEKMLTRNVRFLPRNSRQP